MEAAMAQVLQEMGWDSGFHVPVANEENLALEKELAELVMKKGSSTRKLDSVKERYENLQNHLKYVEKETKQNQSLLGAYTQQLEMERHKYKLHMQEKSTTKLDITRMSKSLKDIEERQSSKRADLAKNVEKLDKIKAEVSWDSEAMQAWEESLKKRDEDNELLKKFSAEDQRKLISMEAKRQNLQVEVIERTEMLHRMSVDISNYEHIMVRTGKILKQMEEERAGLVRQWQEAVKNLRQRDKNIKNLNRDMDTLRDLIAKKQEEINEQNAFLNLEINNNKQLELEIEEEHNLNSRLRKEYQQMLDDGDTNNSEAHAKKSLIESTAHELETAQLKLKMGKQEIIKKTRDIENLNKEVIAAQERLEETKNKAMTAVERMAHFEELISRAKRRQHELAIDNTNMQATLYKNNLILTEAQNIGHLKSSELKGAQNTITIIRKRFKKHSKKLIHQKQLLSDLQMKVACAEAKLGNMEGKGELEEDINTRNQQISDLEASYAEQSEIKNLLQAQIISLEKETLRLVSYISADATNVSKLKDKLQGLIIMVEGGIKQTNAAKLRYQQRQVTENVFKLRVDKLAKAMNREDKEIYNLNRYKLELETVMKERQIEIQMSKEILLAEKRVLDEERGRLRADIAIRKVRIAQFQNKYELVVGMMEKNEFGEPLSMAHYKVKSAQEKFMLQQEGDEIDQKVRQAEAEIIAMENTLKAVNMTNVSFKTNLDLVTVDGDEAKEMKQLEHELKDCNRVLREKKKEYLDKQNSLAEYKKILDNMVNEENNYLEENQQKHILLEEILVELKERYEKIEYIDKQINSSKMKIDEKKLDKYDKQIYIRQLQETSKSIMYQLGDFIADNPETEYVINKYMKDNGLYTPKKRTSMSTISSDSIKSPDSPISASICNVTTLEFDQLSSSSEKSNKSDANFKKLTMKKYI